MISETSKTRINKWIAKYPKDQKQSAVMAALRIVQEDNNGFLTTELMDEVAEFLNMPKVSVYEVATFYSMYEHKPVGKHKICICTNISCMLCGSKSLVQHLENKLDIKMGEVSKDGKFSLKQVECLGACVNAPMLQIGKTYYENLNKDKLDLILDDLSNE